jgi:hypothetical protein
MGEIVSMPEGMAEQAFADSAEFEFYPVRNLRRNGDSTVSGEVSSGNVNCRD